MLKYISLLFFCLFAGNPLVFAQEKNTNTAPVPGEITPEQALSAPVLSGTIIDIIRLPSSEATVIFLIIQDKEEKVWSCKIEDSKLPEGVEEYKNGEYVNIYGAVISQDARQVEAEKIERQAINSEK